MSARSGIKRRKRVKREKMPRIEAADVCAARYTIPSNIPRSIPRWNLLEFSRLGIPHPAKYARIAKNSHANPAREDFPLSAFRCRNSRCNRDEQHVKLFYSLHVKLFYTLPLITR